MKHLKTIQIIVKIAKILAIIALVCSIIGACACALGLVALSILGNSTVVSFIYEETQLNLASSILSLISGLIWCVAEIVLSCMALNYCKRELEAGTPFTYNGAKELMYLGIYSAVIPFVASIVESIVYGMYVMVSGDIFPDLDFSSSFDITFGIALIIISVLCKHGAELAETAQQATEQEQYETFGEENEKQNEENQV